VVEASNFESKRIPRALMVGEFYGRSYQHWADNHLWRKRNALGCKHSHKAMGLYLLPPPIALFWSMVAYVFLHLT
jgi:hypothetical protein